MNDALCTGTPLSANDYVRSLKFNIITFTVNPNENKDIKITDRTGVHQYATLTLIHEKRNKTTSGSYLMTIKNIPDNNLTHYDTHYQHKQYKDIVPHFPAVHQTLHHY